jgi:RimJ/RimL family protein N-acetyltransferase
MKRKVEPFGNGTVQLRPITENDLEMTLEWRNRDEARVWFNNSGTITLHQHRGWFAQYSSKDDDFLFIIEAEGRPVGQASVYRIDWEKGSAEVGRFLAAPDAAGHGHIGIACGELVRFCAGALQLTSIFLEVKENNERAIRIYTRNGFREVERVDGMLRMICSLGQGNERSAHAAGTSTPER